MPAPSSLIIPEQCTRLALASCCAPCSVQAIQELARQPIALEVVFYNPNIHPYEEYEKRKAENKRLCDNLQVPFVDLDYNPERWHSAVRGLEQEPERGKRCSVCFLMRLETIAAYAASRDFLFFSSTFAASRHKSAEQVALAADQAAHNHHIQYLHLNFRSGGRQEERTRLIRDLQVYNQNYCGCQYSRRPAR